MPLSKSSSTSSCLKSRAGIFDRTSEGAGARGRRLTRGPALFCALIVVFAGAWAFTAWRAGVIARRFPPTGAFVVVNDRGSRLHYTERSPIGAERGIVVLVHGASGNQADLMLPLGGGLARAGFRVLAFDRPGRGWSDRPDGEDDASPARQAGLIRAALDALGVRHAIILGHSWSGALAAAFALDDCDLADGLVLLSPVLYPWTTGVAWYNPPAASPLTGPAFTRLFSLPAGLLLLPAGIAEVFAPQAPPEHFAARTGLELLLRPAEFEANAQDVLSLHAFVTALAPRLPAINAPVAIVTGDGDRVVSPEIHSFQAARDIPGARLTVLRGVGHSPHWAAPDAVVAAVLDVADRARARAPNATCR